MLLNRPFLTSCRAFRAHSCRLQSISTSTSTSFLHHSSQWQSRQAASPTTSVHTLGDPDPETGISVAVPSPAFIDDLQAKGIRPYFYFVDHHGQVFLSDVVPKNLTSCIKNVRFLDFFIPRIRPNYGCHAKHPQHPAPYDWVSPCGKELNYVQAGSITPIVFHGLQLHKSHEHTDSHHQQDGQETDHGTLHWAGSKTTPFLPSELAFSKTTGYIYHPLPPSLAKAMQDHHSTNTGASNTELQVDPALEYGLMRSSIVISELGDMLSFSESAYRLRWKGQEFELKELP